ncbi:hypothetical protein [Phenylobacterium sp.]
MRRGILGYVVRRIDLRIGCSAFGDVAQNAMSEARRAIAASFPTT